MREGATSNGHEPLTWTSCESPLGSLTLVTGPGGLRSIYFPGRAPRLPQATRDPMREAVDQIDAYFAGERQDFELELDLRGTPLQERVWELLLGVPYGTTTTYGELAGQIEDSLYPDDVEPSLRPRAVGSAVGSNPVPIVIGCHRVVGADGSLTGYGGGLERKQVLLSLENLTLL